MKTLMTLWLITGQSIHLQVPPADCERTAAAVGSKVEVLLRTPSGVRVPVERVVCLTINKGPAL